MNLTNVARWLSEHPESRLVAEPNILASIPGESWYATCARRDDNTGDFDAFGATLDEALANLEAEAAKTDWDESVAIAEAQIESAEDFRERHGHAPKHVETHEEA